MNLQDWANVAAILSPVIASAALFYAARQIHKSSLVSQGQFWLELEKMFSLHDAVHLKLRPGGEWTDAGKGPATAEEWARVEDYMGLFEHCESLISKGLIDLETFKSMFSYRLSNILANEMIVQEKLCDEEKGWGKFLRLADKLNIPKPGCRQ